VRLTGRVVSHRPADILEFRGGAFYKWKKRFESQGAAGWPT
jgi:hypothetical protein